MVNAVSANKVNALLPGSPQPAAVALPQPEPDRGDAQKGKKADHVGDGGDNWARRYGGIDPERWDELQAPLQSLADASREFAIGVRDSEWPQSLAAGDSGEVMALSRTTMVGTESEKPRCR